MQGDSTDRQQPKEHTSRLYSALAVFNLASVLAGVLLCHNLVASYRRSVDVNREWADRAGAVAELSRTATEANAPGNDVFETRDVPTERARLTESTARYEQSHVRAIAQLRDLPASERTALVERLEQARGALRAMVGEAEAIFRAFEAGDPDTAGRHMASMDRHLAANSSALGELSKTESRLQQQAFAVQSAQAATLGRWAWGLIAVVAVLVGLAVAYGRLLSRKFADAHAQIERRNADMQRVLDHAVQGFATIDLHGQLSDERSARFASLLGATASQRSLEHVLRESAADVADWFRIGLEALRDGMLPVELCIDQLPKRLERDGKQISLEYRPIPSEAPRELLVVASDITAEVERKRVEQENHEIAEIFARAMHDRDGVIDFLAEAGNLVAALRVEGMRLEDEKRLLHTLKGNAALFSLTTLSRLCHELEDAQAERGGPLVAAERQRLGAAWDHMVARLRKLLGEERSNLIEVDERELAAIIEAILNGTAGRDVATRLAAFRLELASRRLERIAEQARAFARRVGKPNLHVRLEPNGVRLSRERWGKLWVSLVHVVRNAIDHGIERSDQRLQAGKAPEGSLSIRTFARDGFLSIAIGDDGRGIDWDRVRELAVERGMASATREDLVRALFTQGFSTRSEVSEISGRGVGLAAVLEALDEVGGSVQVESTLGAGTTFVFTLPYADTEVALRASLRPAGVAA
ncbi:MAG TPA: ATP-binding protein [Polyangiales bacterium]|nr:ATP-binding protein [Polyangiales bacterium]